MKNFLPRINIPIAGRVQTAEYAINWAQSVVSLKLPLNSASATGSVFIESELVTINGHIKLFQALMNVKIPRVIIAGTASGSAILTNICHVVQPSILAEFSSSFGKDWNHCRIRKTPKPPKSPGRINAWSVSIWCNSFITKKSGIILTWGGIIIEISISMNKGSRNLKCNLAKANPAIEEIITWPIVVNVATNNELKKKRKMSEFLKICFQPSSTNGEGKAPNCRRFVLLS